MIALLLSLLLQQAPGLTQAPAAGEGAGNGRYRIEPVPKTPAELTARFTDEQIAVLERLNRRDREHLIRTEPPVPGLVVPTTWDFDPLADAPFPLEWPSAAAQAKYLVVHQAAQAFGAYEFGRLVRWGPVSTGRKETATPSGTYNLTWRSRKRTSTDNDAWVLEWYFNFINSRGISFHQFDLPGYAASHACVRMLQRDAQWLYGWGEQWQLSPDHRSVVVPGTPVLIIGVFGHGKVPPWTSLEWLATPISLPSQVQ